MNDAELRSLERLCSRDDLSDGNVATLTVLGLTAAAEIRKVRTELAVAEAEIRGLRDVANAAERERDLLRTELAEAHEALTAQVVERRQIETELDAYRAMLADLLASAHPHPTEHPTMAEAWDRARDLLKNGPKPATEGNRG